MNITSSYAVACLNVSRKTFQPTINIYQNALAFMINVFNLEWDYLSQIEKATDRQTAAEHLIHTTKDNTAKYDFDTKFYKFPSYLRRAVRNAALGIVSSYHSNYKNWEDNGKPGAEPKLSLSHYRMPCFYRTDMAKWDEDFNNNEINLKLYNGSDWVWVKIKLRKSDVKYLHRYWRHVESSAPTLEKRYGRYYLRFAFTEKQELYNINFVDGQICAVDLGLNTDAACCILKPDGTVVARKFINFPAEKDHLWTVLNRIKRRQREQGPQSIRSLWRYAKSLNDELAKMVANAIVDFAVLHSAEVLVFEHLDFTGKRAKGNKKQKLQMWRKNGIQAYATHKAYRCAMHVSHICAWNTSRLAFDGSGMLERNNKNRALAIFQNGKQYNCDLNASYNIGARYYIRELPKTLPAKDRSQLLAKDQAFGRRASATLSTLKMLYPEWYIATTGTACLARQVA